MMNCVRGIMAWAALSSFTGCGHQPAAPAAKAQDAPSTCVLVSPQRKVLHRVINQPGTIQAFEEAPLHAKLAGYVSAVKADIGDRVKGPRQSSPGKPAEPGQILAEISIPELEAEAQQKAALVVAAEAGVDQAQKALKSSEATIAAAEAVARETQAGLARAQANYDRWESESKRIANLVKDRVIDEQTRDETTNQFRAAEAARAEAQARIGTAEAQVRKAKAERDKAAADVHAAEAHSQVAQADARRVQALLQYTKIRAPFDGIVTRRNVDTGHFLQPAGAQSEPIFTVMRSDPVRVFVDVPESDAALIYDHAEAHVAVQALKGPDLVGKVTRTAWALSPGARTLRTEIDLQNPDGRLRPGMYVYARLGIELTDAWVVPNAALAKQGEETICFRVVDGKAVRTVLLVGQTDGEFTQVLKWKKPGAGSEWQDWRGDESVVGGGVAGISDGQAIPKRSPEAR
jgi:HlyD family secretion protein